MTSSSNKRSPARARHEAEPSTVVPASGLIVREKSPVNLEMPFGELAGFITPVERFYVRCHHPIPDIDADTWRLKIEGEVEHPLELGYAELVEMATRTITVAMECAGNGRVFLEPQRDGAQWEAGAVGNAEWTGVPLAYLLNEAGVKDSAQWVVAEGADGGSHSRSLPLKALLEHGMVDAVVHRHRLRETLIRMVSLFMDPLVVESRALAETGR